MHDIASSILVTEAKYKSEFVVTTDYSSPWDGVSTVRNLEEIDRIIMALHSKSNKFAKKWECNLNKTNQN